MSVEEEIRQRAEREVLRETVFDLQRRMRIIESALGLSPEPPEMPAPDVPAKPKIITRAAWRALSVGGDPAAMQAIQGVVVHHTAGTMRIQPELAISEMQAIQRYHMDVNKWSDIGYHYVIDGAGRIYEGRDEGYAGAHCPGKNKTHIGIALMGNFETTHPSDEALKALEDLSRYYMAAEGFSAAGVTGHRDHRATLCPGVNIYDKLNDLRRRLAT